MAQQTLDDFVLLYRRMFAARHVDAIEMEMIGRGEAFFHVSSSGHEAVAALNAFLIPDDFLHCHYRDKALMLARGLGVDEFFNSLICSSSSHSNGRQMSAHLCSPELHILSTVGPVGNNALQAAGVAQEILDQPSRPIVLCAMGDGTTQQGEVMEAIGESERWNLPVLFLIEDNGYAISSKTKGSTFFSLRNGDASEFHGVRMTRVNGSDIPSCLEAFETIVSRMREDRAPHICVMSLERLSAHTNSDDESIYRQDEELQRRHARDPVSNLRSLLVQQGFPEENLREIEEQIVCEVSDASVRALDNYQHPGTETRLQESVKLPLPERMYSKTFEHSGAGGAELTMAEAIRESLHYRLGVDARISLYGEDIEDPKGDVFGLTRGLSTSFPGRVRNSPLSESTIVGTSIGRALAGGRPVAFLQFADFIPLAFNQIASELASMYWRTNGRMNAPVLILASCGGYRPGLGPFHAQTFDSILAHTPGLDVAMPSTAGDAAGMINAALDSERPTILLYPKALLGDRSRMTARDVPEQRVVIGKSRLCRSGDKLTIVAWGNTVPISEAAAGALSDAGFECDVIDLRWLSPWDSDRVIHSSRKTGRLLVVHEDSKSAGFGAEIVATVQEALGNSVRSRRIGRQDAFIPCNFKNQLDALPSFRQVVETAAELLDVEVGWILPPAGDQGRIVVAALGSGPSDQTVRVIEMHAEIGSVVKTGQTLATLEADKAIIDVCASADGTVLEMHAGVDDLIPVESPLFTLGAETVRHRQPLREQPGTPVFKPRPGKEIGNVFDEQTVVISGIGVCRGNDRLTNEDLEAYFPQLGGARGIYERTGIVARLVADETQDCIGMALEAARNVLKEAGMKPEEISLIICSTSTPATIAPSTACHVLHGLAPGIEIPAYDVLAACSGFLYALGNAWDYLQNNPDATVLVLTTEAMRKVVDIGDPETSPIFADAATATLVTTRRNLPAAGLVVKRPVLSAFGTSGETLTVPVTAPFPPVRMDGKKVFSEGIRRMGMMLKRACADAGISEHDLDLLLPHQANGRMIEALRKRIGLPEEKVVNLIRNQGNTSSSSIPLALSELMGSKNPGGQRIGLCAFGAGYTYGSAILISEARS